MDAVGRSRITELCSLRFGSLSSQSSEQSLWRPTDQRLYCPVLGVTRGLQVDFQELTAAVVWRRRRL